VRIETIIAPTDEPLSLAAAKLFCRIDPDLADEDSLIMDLIRAAREQIEIQTSRALAPQTLRLVIDGFPKNRSSLPLPRFPLISITSVKYDDEAGDEQTWDTADYNVITGSLPGAIHAEDAWPATIARPGSVRITYMCGYGHTSEGSEPSTEAAPERAVTAIKYLVNHWYERRDAVLAGTIATVLPMAVRSLIDPLKIRYALPIVSI